MATESNVQGRDLVIKEITDTVRYLMKKNSEGTESIGLEELLDKKLITKEEYEKQKEKILEQDIN